VSDCGGEVTVGGNHEQSHVSLGGTGDHVLDEITVTGGINDGVVPLLGVELLAREEMVTPRSRSSFCLSM